MMLTSEQPEGIFFGMSSEEYHAAPGLSHSGMKALAESPLMYWHRFIAKEQEEPSTAARFGSLVHCRLLEPKRFAETWAVPPSIEAYPGALCVQEDLKRWLGERRLPVSGTKPQQIERIQRHAEQTGEEVVIWDAILADWRKANEGKRELSQLEADRIRAIGDVIRNHKYASAMLSNGFPEVSIFVRDPNTGILLKARLDWMKRRATNDLKTFTRYRGESPDDAVARVLRFERYDRQGVFYKNMREYARLRLAEDSLPIHGAPDGARLSEWLDEFIECRDHAFGFVFVEADAPHHVVLREIKRVDRDGNVNLFWDDSELFIERMIARYAACGTVYGDAPWRSVDPASLVSDLNFPNVVFSTSSSEEFV